MGAPDCPPRDRLLRLLDERLSATESEAVTAHADACGACQQVLEELTAGAGDLRARLQRIADEQGRPTPDFPFPKQALPEVAGCEVLGVLGRGGEGVVYRALGRLVALKLVRGLTLAAQGKLDEAIAAHRQAIDE